MQRTSGSALERHLQLAKMHKRAEGTKMFTRRGHDWSSRTKTIVRAAHQLKTDAALLDGEVVVQTPEGLQDFSALESAVGREVPDDRLLFYVFDILHLEGADLTDLPLSERREALGKVAKTFAIRARLPVTGCTPSAGVKAVMSHRIRRILIYFLRAARKR